MDTYGVKLVPEFKARWVAALRSGAYIQGTRYLKSKRHASYGPGQQYCCLGVALELTAGKAFTEKVVTGHTVAYKLRTPRPDPSNTDLPNEKDALEFGWFDRCYKGGIMLVLKELSSMNDSGYSFNNIADEIEAYL